MKRLFLSLLLLALVNPAFARTWTSKDGKTTIEAEFLSATDKDVTILRSDNRKFTIPFTMLSNGDVNWLKANSKIPKPKPADSPLGLGAESMELPERFPDEVAQMLQTRGANLLFQDDFERTDSNSSDDLGRDWVTNSEQSADRAKQTDIDNGGLVITLSDKAKEPVAVRHELSEPFKDGVVSAKVMFEEEEEEVTFAFGDREDAAVEGGQVNGVTVALKKLAIADNKAEGDAGTRDKTIALKPGEWTDVVTVHDGDMLTVYLNGYKLLTHKSPGIAHETKRDFVFAVPKKATVDELKIWKLAPAPSE